MGPDDMKMARRAVQEAQEKLDECKCRFAYWQRRVEKLHGRTRLDILRIIVSPEKMVDDPRVIDRDIIYGIFEGTHNVLVKVLAEKAMAESELYKANNMLEMLEMNLLHGIIET